MKAVILAGGLGTRLSEETEVRPKPMVEIGGMPILWHIMKIYAAHGVNEFVVCCGYKGYVIKEYFANYFLHQSDVTFDLSANNRMEIHRHTAEDWRVTLINTGDDTQTGGRLKRIREYVEQDEAFCFTYGDGLSDVDISALIDYHQQHQAMATVTAVQPLGRFGVFNLQDDHITGFEEKPKDHNNWINGGFFVLSPQIFDYIADDQTSWEAEPMETLAQQDQLRAFRHQGFWQPMDTLRDRNLLNALWESGEAPWKRW